MPVFIIKIIDIAIPISGMLSICYLLSIDLFQNIFCVW